MASQFYLTLPSNTVENYNQYRKPVDNQARDIAVPSETSWVNKQSEYRVHLPQSIHLEGEWEVGLSEIIYPHSWFNIYSDGPTNCHIFVALVGVAQPLVCAVPAGSYETPELIAAAINRQMHVVLSAAGFNGKDLEVLYDTLSRRMFLICSPKVRKIAIGDRLRYMLGLDDGKKVKSHWFSPDKIVSTYPVDVRGGFDTMYVYCDLVANQVVGDSLVPLLRVVNVEGHPGDVVSRNFTNPHYVPLARQEFSTVEINIKDDTNRSVGFMGGKVTVKLHFRKQKFTL